MIAIIGGTGTVGSEVVKQLAATGAKARVLARTPDKVLKSASLETVQGDYSDAAALDKLLAGVSKLFLLLPSIPGSVESASKVVEAAKRAGVKHVVRLSVLGVDTNSPAQLSRWHAETEQNLKASGLAWTMLQPTSFAQNFLRSAATIKKDGTFFGAYGEGKMCLIDARDIAAVAVKALTSDGHEGKSYPLTGQEPLTNAELAAKLGAALGTKVTYVNLPPDKLKQGMLAAGVPEWLAADFMAMQGWTANGHSAKPDPTLPSLIGKVRNFDDFLATYAAAFK
jgi:uncharacterized protein YbjT (DUF2867 family)